MGKLKTINKKLTQIISFGGLAMAMSTYSHAQPARIVDLSDSSTADSSVIYQPVTKSETTTYSEPPANIQTKQTKTQTTAVTTNSSTSQTTTNNGVVTTTQERIEYNRNYGDIPKGGYKGDSYTVKRGDTLFYIAWITGNDFRSLAAKNNIKAPYDLTVGQTLNVGGSTSVVVTKQTTIPKDKTTKPTTKTVTTTTTTSSNPPKKTTTTTTTTNKTTPAPSATVANIKWQWPANGKIIEKFSNATKGIDIAGKLGDKIVSAADGKVVYAGNALAGYGNLIIVKHNDDYLTAYAHNQTILVKEQQDVKAGQQIGTMGNSGASSVRLHFEIRYEAKSVDPLKYLPKK